MTFLQYYLFANIYILVFWIFYRIWLQKLIYFRSVRIYLNSALVLSSILPLIQFGIADFIGSTNLVTTGQELPLVGIVYKYHLTETLPVTAGNSYNWTRFIVAILISGSIATAFIYTLNLYRIRSVIRKSTEYLRLEKGVKALKSNEVTIPFIYLNRIVIPTKIADKDISQVIKHEVMHYHNAHHFDNMLFSLIHVVFWANPFFLLLRRALKLNHEFQVDQQILSTGVDPVSYKLSLVEYSVGRKLFSLANGLSHTNTKNRLQMMNNNHSKKGKWRFLLLVPTITILFIAFTFAYIQPDASAPLELSDKSPNESLAKLPQDDTLVVEFIDPYDVPEGTTVTFPKNNVIIILLNRGSKIMIAGEELPLQNVEQKIISEYNRILEENTSFETKIYLTKDRAADNIEYQKLVDVISDALFKLRDMHSIRLYGATYNTLPENEKEAIATLIPLRIYGTIPEGYAEQAIPPLFKGEEKDEFMYYIGQNLRYPEAAGEAGITGRVVVQAVIESDGSVGDVNVVKGAHPDLDQEAIRVIKSSPKWTPATKDLKKVQSTVQFAINFALN